MCKQAGARARWRSFPSLDEDEVTTNEAPNKGLSHRGRGRGKYYRVFTLMRMSVYLDTPSRPLGLEGGLMGAKTPIRILFSSRVHGY